MPKTAEQYVMELTQPHDGAMIRRVAAGAAELDQRLPGWRQHVHADILDLANSDNCVLGQIAVGLDLGNYPDMLRLMVGSLRDEATHTWAYERGYTPYQDSRFDRPNDDPVALTALWRKLI